MNRSVIRQWAERSPFQEFIIYCSDGRSYRAEYQDYLPLAKNSRTITLWDEQLSPTIIEVFHITAIERVKARDKA